MNKDREDMARELRDLRRREAEICRALNGEPKAPPPLVVPGVCVISYAIRK